MKPYPRPVYLFRILLSFVFATLMFIAIFGLAYAVSYLNYQSLQQKTSVIEAKISEMNALMERFSCDDSLFFESSEQLAEARQKMALIERRFGKTDMRVLEQKEFYSELQYRHFLLMKRFNEQCNASFIPILFFYSNTDTFLDEGELMGYVLEVFRSHHEDSVLVYSFDYDLPSPAINYLREKYDIHDVPIVVYNEWNILKVKHIRDLDKLYES